MYLLDAPPDVRPDTQVVVQESLVPLRWWRNLPVRREAATALTGMERFVLETVLAFGAAAPAEFEEVTDLPAHMLPVLGRRLVAAGALTSAGTPADDALCRRMLLSEQIEQERVESVHVVVLPDVGEILVLDRETGGDDPFLGWERARVQPVSRYPVDESIRGRSLGDLLAGTAGIRGVEADVVAFDQGLCPVFRCAAQVTGDSGADVSLSIGDGAPAVLLPDVKSLVERWRGVDRVLAERPSAIWRAMLGSGTSLGRAPAAQRMSPARWQIAVTGEQAARLCAAGRNLAQPTGLAVETSEVVVEVALEIAAADVTAEAAIAVDTAINAGVAEGSTAAAVHARLAKDAARLPYDAVRALAAAKVVERAWQLGHYRLAYALRERDDFDYA
ncbi:hypothetical protein KOI35_42435 [Actinoplanes bogorensis]|uniref:Uncharacterized protein n=1 Tax=Paractinoplanes bogorensis TaxID=1610840 RepID=A0ABS5Z3A2_9ACTN|nr:hypothetical protein [Actinoplanes bogorensis]MBU2670179.1 hypothetical protein [Actinoplanes bogorensis]